MSSEQRSGLHRHLAHGAGALTGVASIAGCIGGDDSLRGDEDPSESPQTTLERCDAKREELIEEIRTLEAQISLAERDLQQSAIQSAEMRGQIAEFEGLSPHVVEKARDIATQSRESVIFVQATEGWATGWFIDPGYIITNAHNVADPATGEPYSDTLTGFAIDGSEFTLHLEAHVESMQPDIALLTTEYSEVRGLELAPSNSLEIGDPLMIIGHPGGVAEWVVSAGLLIERVAQPDLVRLRSSVPARQGNSGSPVLNLDGQVVGIHYASQPRGQRDADERRPLPADPFVYDWEIAPRVWEVSYGSEDIERHYNMWK